MSRFYNEKQAEAFKSGEYYCRECGELMEFEDEHEDSLICHTCGFSQDSDYYGFSSDDEYDALFPTEEEVLARDDD